MKEKNIDENNRIAIIVSVVFLFSVIASSIICSILFGV